jgi:hypothetical protein
LSNKPYIAFFLLVNFLPVITPPAIWHVFHNHDHQEIFKHAENGNTIGQLHPHCKTIKIISPVFNSVTPVQSIITVCPDQFFGEDNYVCFNNGKTILFGERSPPVFNF